jgi:hypothetical protein
MGSTQEVIFTLGIGLWMDYRALGGNSLDIGSIQILLLPEQAEELLRALHR